MLKNTGKNMSIAHSGKWLVDGVTLGLLVAGTAAWLRLRESEENFGELHHGYSRFTKAKDTVNKAAQKVREANPSAEQQIVDVEKELHPGG